MPAYAFLLVANGRHSEDVHPQSLICSMSWMIAFTVLSVAFLRSAWRDWQNRQWELRSWANFGGTLYCLVAVAGQLVTMSLGKSLQQRVPPLAWLVLALLGKGVNFGITAFMLHRYTHICGDWTRSSWLAKARWPITVVLCMFLTVWLVLDAMAQPLSWTSESMQWHLSTAWYVPYLLIIYYIVLLAVEVLCLANLFYLRIRAQQGRLRDDLLHILYPEPTVALREVPRSPSTHMLNFAPAIRRISLRNWVLVCCSILMLGLEFDWVRRQFVVNGLFGWPMLALYSTRFFVIRQLLRPCSSGARNAEDALHAGSYHERYKFFEGEGLVICNTAYQYANGLEPLPGNEHEANGLKEVSEVLGFNTRIEFNLTGQQIRQRMEALASRARENNSDGVALFFSGHGGADCIIGIDGVVPPSPHELPLPFGIEMAAVSRRAAAAAAHSQVRISSGSVPREDLVDILWKEDSLLEKPKLLFFDCCRGSDIEIRSRTRARVSRQTFQHSSERLGRGSGTSLYADFLFSYATADGQSAHNVNVNGQLHGVFSVELLKVLKGATTPTQGSAPQEIEQALKQVKREVASQPLGANGLKRQCPEIQSFLTRSFVLQPRSQQEERTITPEPDNLRDRVWSS